MPVSVYQKQRSSPALRQCLDMAKPEELHDGKLKLEAGKGRMNGDIHSVRHQKLIYAASWVAMDIVQNTGY